MKKLLHNHDAGLLLIRLGVAAVFIVHGWMAFGNLAATGRMLAAAGISAHFAILLAAIELIGGLLLLFGLAMRWAGVLLALVMLVMVGAVKFKLGFVGGYEFDLVLLLASFGLACTGAGRYSLRK